MRDSLARVIGDTVVGARAALRAPRVIDTSLKPLLDAPVARAGVPGDCARPIRVAHRLLGVLARLPGRHWRNTCLFRSVAECEVRRARGWPARLAIGVGSAGDGVIAHSWVEMAGIASTPGTPVVMSPLRPARAQAID